MNKQVFKEDLEEFSKTFPFADKFDGMSVLITGGTGLIGRCLVECLLYSVKDIRILMPVRNKVKAEQMFNAIDSVDIIECNLAEYLKARDLRFDYAFHCASPTEGKYISEHPASTFNMMYETTSGILEAGKRCGSKGIIYLSSVEYYGVIESGKKVSEETIGYIDYTSRRSAYPLGKRACEFLCRAYAEEYGLDVKIVRPTQTFGAGGSLEDNRVFAQFARSIVKGEDIVLHTAGLSSKSYCYTTDLVSGLMYVLFKGESGMAYNIANPRSYTSIRELACFLSDNFNQHIKVKIELHPEMSYAPDTYLDLSVEKISRLGWTARIDLKEMFRRYLAYIN